MNPREASSVQEDVGIRGRPPPRTMRTVPSRSRLPTRPLRLSPDPRPLQIALWEWESVPVPSSLPGLVPVSRPYRPPPLLPSRQLFTGRGAWQLPHQLTEGRTDTIPRRRMGGRL